MFPESFYRQREVMFSDECLATNVHSNLMSEAPFLLGYCDLMK